MKKTFLILLASTLCFCSSAYANYDSSFYVKFLSGVNFLQTESSSKIKPCFDPGYIVSGAVGYFWWSGLHIEGEYAFRRNSLKQLHYFGQNFDIPGSFQSSSYMANLFWNFGTGECSVQPFFGGGIGYDVQQFHGEQDGFRINKNNKGFSWQLMVGVNFPLLTSVDVGVEYRFHKGPIRNFYSHVLGVNMAYKFGGECY